MSYTSGSSQVTFTQWNAIGIQPTSAAALQLNVTAMPQFIIIPKEMVVETSPIIKVTKMRDVSTLNKEAILNDPIALQELYAQFAEKDKQLTQLGMIQYLETLDLEESTA
jgi:hypothetical protein